MLDKENNNTIENGIKQEGVTNVKVGTVSKVGVAITESHIRVEGNINVTTVIKAIKSSGLNPLPPQLQMNNNRNNTIAF